MYTQLRRQFSLVTRAESTVSSVASRRSSTPPTPPSEAYSRLKSRGARRGSTLHLNPTLRCGEIHFIRDSEKQLLIEQEHPEIIANDTWPRNASAERCEKGTAQKAAPKPAEKAAPKPARRRPRQRSDEKAPAKKAAAAQRAKLRGRSRETATRRGQRADRRIERRRVRITRDGDAWRATHTIDGVETVLSDTTFVKAYIVGVIHVLMMAPSSWDGSAATFGRRGDRSAGAMPSTRKSTRWK